MPQILLFGEIGIIRILACIGERDALLTLLCESGILISVNTGRSNIRSGYKNGLGLQLSFCIYVIILFDYACKKSPTHD